MYLESLGRPTDTGLQLGKALGIWTSFGKREGSTSMDMWNAPMVQSRQPLPTG